MIYFRLLNEYTKNIRKARKNTQNTSVISIKKTIRLLNNTSYLNLITYSNLTSVPKSFFTKNIFVLSRLYLLR